MCVCVTERKRDRQTETQRQTDRDRQTDPFTPYSFGPCKLTVSFSFLVVPFVYAKTFLHLPFQLNTSSDERKKEREREREREREKQLNAIAKYLMPFLRLQCLRAMHAPYCSTFQGNVQLLFAK